MTYEEARKTIMSDADYGGVGEKAKKTADALCIAIEALEKQIPKKPEDAVKRKVADWIEGRCPVCGSIVFKPNGCPKCLQAIDWSEEE